MIMSEPRGNQGFNLRFSSFFQRSFLLQSISKIYRGGTIRNQIPTSHFRVTGSLSELIESKNVGPRWRIKRSGVRGLPTEAETTAEIVEALKEMGVPVRVHSMGSPANVDSYHIEAQFADGGLFAKTGSYWYERRGAWIEGPQAVAFVGVSCDRKISRGLLKSLQSIDPGIDSYIADRQAESAVVLHVPHASSFIPNDVRSSFILSDSELRAELLNMTDHFTDDLVAAAIPVAKSVVFRVSRLVVDPERFAQDEREPMSRVGMGVIYKCTAAGAALRKPLLGGERRGLITKYYQPHHEALTEATERALSRHGRCLILDIHSFPSRPLPYELDQDPDRPDICLGTDQFHTPTDLVERARITFEAEGLSVAINRPFAGALVPMKVYGKDARVSALMIEVNRRLYMDEKLGIKSGHFETMRKVLAVVLGSISKHTVVGAATT